MPIPPSSHRARKRFGQNFLHDTGVINQIITAIHPLEDEHLVEIGPGQGALTEYLVGSGCRLDVVELDRDLVPGLLTAYGESPGFKLHSADALGFDYSGLVGRGAGGDCRGATPLAMTGEKAAAHAMTGHRKLRVVGNLPYNISTPLIFKLLENAEILHDMHFMLQLEVVNRLAASPGSKSWGRLGIMAQYHCRVESLFEVPPHAFSPAPKVQSAIVRLQPHTDSPWPQCDETILRRVVQAAFAQRRKTLRNNLKGLIDVAELEALGIDPGARAETLELLQFIEIANGSHGKN